MHVTVTPSLRRANRAPQIASDFRAGGISIPRGWIPPSKPLASGSTRFREPWRGRRYGSGRLSRLSRLSRCVGVLRCVDTPNGTDELMKAPDRLSKFPSSQVPGNRREPGTNGSQVPGGMGGRTTPEPGNRPPHMVTVLPIGSPPSFVPSRPLPRARWTRGLRWWRAHPSCERLRAWRGRCGSRATSPRAGRVGTSRRP